VRTLLGVFRDDRNRFGVYALLRLAALGFAGTMTGTPRLLRTQSASNRVVTRGNYQHDRY
jgi:hypothetical protein